MAPLIVSRNFSPSTESQCNQNVIKEFQKGHNNRSFLDMQEQTWLLFMRNAHLSFSLPYLKGSLYVG